jgi:hypothetical protein
MRFQELFGAVVFFLFICYEISKFPSHHSYSSTILPWQDPHYIGFRRHDNTTSASRPIITSMGENKGLRHLRHQRGCRPIERRVEEHSGDTLTRGTHSGGHTVREHRGGTVLAILGESTHWGSSHSRGAFTRERSVHSIVLGQAQAGGAQPSVYKSA